jgi:hypothetical protein
MTQLSNIFIGDKVVQQVYLNDALMYQSNGWQALPTTPQEVWVKQYPMGTHPVPISITLYALSAIDSANNIIIVEGDIITKIDSEGVVIWTTKLQEAPNVYTIFCFLQIDSDDNIWLAANKTFYEFDSSGKQLQSFVLPSYYDFFNDFTVYKDKIYIIARYTNTGIDYNYHILVFDKQGNVLKTISNITDNHNINRSAYILPQEDNIITITYNDYIKKIDIINGTVAGSRTINSDSSLVCGATTDIYGNIYVAKQSSDCIYKYDANLNLLWKSDFPADQFPKGYETNHLGSLSLDSNNCIYLSVWLYNSNKINLIEIARYETNGTLSWSSVYSNDASHGYGCLSQITQDKKGNVYTPVLNNNAIELHKLINLTKEN